MALGGEKSPSPHRSQRAWWGAAAAGLGKPEWTLGIGPAPAPSCRATLAASSPFNSSCRRRRPGGGWSPRAGFSPPGPLHRGCPPPRLSSCTPFSPQTAGCAALGPSQPSARCSPVLSPAGTLPQQAPRTGCSAKGPQRRLAQGRAPPASLCPLAAPPMQAEQGPQLGGGRTGSRKEGEASATLPRAG